jgi:tetratricopeptide (TPR) repeat protein
VANKSERETRKELRQPDAFQSAGAQAGDWIVERRRPIAIGLALLVLVGAGAALASYLSGRGEGQAARELGQTLEVLERPVEGEAQVDPTADKPPFKTHREKDEAVRKALSDFRSARGGTKAATTAALPLAQAEYRLGNHDAALAAYDDFLKGAPSEDPLRASAMEGRGYALEAKGQLDQALTAFEQMTKSEREEFLIGMGSYHQARILIQQGKQQEAVQALQQIPVKHPNSAAARLANERLKVLASQGVAIPPPPAADPAPDAG